MRVVDCSMLKDVFEAEYTHQVFAVGQLMAVRCDGLPLRLQCINIDTVDGDNGSHDSFAPRVGAYLHGAIINFTKGKDAPIRLTNQSSGMTRTVFKPDFDFTKLGIGGLDKEFNDIFRRAFASRLFPTDVIQKLGIQHVRGMLLFGPPGCGKTLIARKISQALTAQEPKVVNGPEILDKFVGESERKIRELFSDARKDQEELGDESDVHIIIFDEIDAICKQRGSSRDGTGVGDSVVNQLLTQIDGVDSLNNVLVIAHQELLGAEIEGLVVLLQPTPSHVVPMADHARYCQFNPEISMEDFALALEEVKPKFGAPSDQLALYYKNGLIPYGSSFTDVREALSRVIEQVRSNDKTPLMSVLLHGERGAGKTALATYCAVASEFPLVRMVKASELISRAESGKCSYIYNVFEEAYRSPRIIILDDIERLMDYVGLGPRFSNLVLQADGAGAQPCARGWPQARGDRLTSNIAAMQAAVDDPYNMAKKSKGGKNKTPTSTPTPTSVKKVDGGPDQEPPATDEQATAVKEQHRRASEKVDHLLEVRPDAEELEQRNELRDLAIVHGGDGVAPSLQATQEKLQRQINTDKFDGHSLILLEGELGEDGLQKKRSLSQRARYALALKAASRIAADKLISAEEKARLKDLILSDDEKVVAALECYELDEDIEEMLDTLYRVAKVST
ncbi:CDC48 domain 2-like [Phytophthora cactorum]|nr:CDC48 domain 2-like [Phytophthora cactorum]